MIDQEMEDLDLQLEESNFFLSISRSFIKLKQVHLSVFQRFLSHPMK